MSVRLKHLKCRLAKAYSNYWFTLAIALLTVVYVCFPNNNHMFDSYNYGASVKYGVDLFLAHHLLYSYANWLIYNCIQLFIPTIDALKLMQFTNACFALLSLLLLRRILTKQTNNRLSANVWTFFIGCSFGFMRFSVEAETYIFPIFFSLLASNFYLNFIQTKNARNIFYSGLFASVACLFHQIHLFWGIALFVGFLFATKPKQYLLYVLPTPLVLIGYSLVLLYYKHILLTASNLLMFMAEYYFSPKADVSVGVNNLVITVITFFRTFFQVHGIVLDVLRIMPLFYLIIPVVLILLGFAIVKAVKTTKIEKNISYNSNFELTHLLVFMLQFGFAFYSHGNSEFMIMLPFLMAIFLPLFLKFDAIVLKSLATGMLIWNFSFGILPNNFLNYQNNQELSTFIHNSPNMQFVLKEGGFVRNQYFYHYGAEVVNRVFEKDELNLGGNSSSNSGIYYTDILTKKVPYNRGNFTSKTPTNNMIFLGHVKHINSSLGGFYVDKVRFTK